MQTKRRFKKTQLALAISSACFLMQHSGAAQAQSASESILEEIIVTATRREQSVQSVPYNITAITGDEIEMLQIVDPNELMRNTTGVHVIDRGPRNNNTASSLVIRGVNMDSSIKGDQAVSGVSAVSVYIGETPLFANFFLHDIDRVEVLRGPQGTLYGSGSVGGTIRYIANDPDVTGFSGNVSGYVSQTGHSDDTNWSGNFVVNVPVSDTFAVRLAAGRADIGGYIDYPNIYDLNSDGNPAFTGDILTEQPSYHSEEDANWFESNYGRLSMLWEPNDKVRFLLAYQTQSDDVGGRQAETNGPDGFGNQYGDYELGSVMAEPSTRDVDLISLEAEFDLGFATLTSATSTYDQSGEGRSDNSGWYVNAGFYYYYAGSPRPMFSANRSYYDEAFVQELRLVSNGEGKIDWILGGFLMEQDLGATQFSWQHGWADWAVADAAVSWHTVAFDPGTGFFWRDGWQMLTDNDFDYDRNEEFSDKALFGEVTYNFTDTFRTIVGLRYFDNEFTSDVRLDLPPFLNFQSRTERTVSDDDVLGKLNMSWDFSDQHMTYFTVAEGYRRGGTNAVPTEGSYQDDPGWMVYDSDSVVSYELGVKGSTARWRYNVSLFRIDWDDLQINTSSSNGFFVVANAEEARSEGIEFDVDGYLTDNLHLRFGYAYLDAKLTKDATFPGFTSPNVFAGVKLPGSADHTANLGVDYTQGLRADNYLVYRLGGYYQSETENVAADSGLFAKTFDAFWIWDASITYGTDNWHLSLYGKNLFDEKGFVGEYPEAWMGTNPAQNYFGNSSRTILATPRVIGVSAKYSF